MIIWNYKETVFINLLLEKSMAHKYLYMLSCLLYIKAQSPAGSSSSNLDSMAIKSAGIGSATAVNTDIGLCTCDVTVSACDWNCCCDRECSNQQKKLFALCKDSLQLPTDYSYLCQYNTSIFENNTKKSVEITNPNLFCMWRDGFIQRDYYAAVELVQNKTSYENTLVSKGFLYNVGHSTSVDTAENYKSGAPLIISRANDQEVFALPSPSGLDNTCIDTNPTRFLYNTSTECIRHLRAPCGNDSMFVNSDLLKEFFKTRRFKVSPSDNTSFVVNLTEKNSMSNSTSRCQNVIKKVEILVGYDASFAITSASVHILTGGEDAQTVVQKYSVTFSQEKISPAFKRSGNPGYVIGKPVISGKLVDSYIKLGADPSQYLTLVTSRGDGKCVTSSASRIPILFGEDIRTGCFLERSSSNCGQLVNELLLTLLGPDSFLYSNGNAYIASFGNSDPLRVDDWVPVTVTNTTSSECSGLASHLKILYSNVGSLSNPQAKIVLAKLSIDSIPPTPFCYGDGCSVRFTLISSVSFVDASFTPQTTFAEIPVSNSKLPHDFFRPLYHSNDGNSMLTKHSFSTLLFIYFCYFFDSL